MNLGLLDVISANSLCRVARTRLFLPGPALDSRPTLSHAGDELLGVSRNSHSADQTRNSVPANEANEKTGENATKRKLKEDLEISWV